MRLECDADARVWAEVVDIWTRRMLREFSDILQAGLDGDEDANERLRDYYRRVIRDACLVDADGNEYRGVDAILDINDGHGMDNVDAAVAYFWATLPEQAFLARQRLGNARRVG